MRPLLLGLALLAPASASSAEATVRRFALAVGANDGGPERTVLRYAHADAEAMRTVLTSMGGVAPDDGALVLDPSVASLKAEMAALAERIEGIDGRTEVFFYYSGHSDEEGLLLGSDRLSWAELRLWMDGLDAKVRMAVLDSCASGALIRSKGGVRVAPFLVDEGTSVDGLAYITSSSRDEVSQEADRLGGSYFTHYFTTGLRGAADLSGDGRVTLTEAYAFARDETLRKTERTRFGPQHANHEFDLSGSGELVLTELGNSDAAIVLDLGLVGRASVRDPEGHLVAELYKPADRALSLSMPSGEYQLTLTDEGRYGVADVSIDPGQSTPVAMTDLEWFDGEAAVPRGDAIARLTPRPVPASNDGVRAQWIPGFPPTPEGTVDQMLFGFIAADSEQLDGIGVGLVSLDVRGPQTGHTFVVGASGARDLWGSQWSMGANVARGEIRGAQVTLGANVASADTYRIVQSALGANWLEGTGDGAQLGSVNVARGGLRGLQAGAVNSAQVFSGLQLGLINVGSRVDGAQIGLVNVARDVGGMQLGLINVAREVRGAPIGLLSFEKEGRHDLLVFASETDWLNGELRLGGDYLYTYVGAGGTPSARAYAAAGIGAHAPVSKWVWLDFDAGCAGYTDLTDPGALFESSPALVPRARSTVGVQIAKQFAPFVGASLNVAIPQSTPSPSGPIFPTAPPDAGQDPGPAVKVWPGVFAGLQF